ncbi:Fic family protein [Streptococcus rifensis]
MSTSILYLAYFYRSNCLHPFIEGNGRTQREISRVLALSKGYIGQIAPEVDEDVYQLYMDGKFFEHLQPYLQATKL